MKRLVLCMLFLAAGLFADEYVTGNKTMDLKVENGVVHVFLKGAETPILTIKPTMDGDVVADTVTHPDSNYKILSLRTATSSITFKMGWSAPDLQPQQISLDHEDILLLAHSKRLLLP